MSLEVFILWNNENDVMGYSRFREYDPLIILPSTSYTNITYNLMVFLLWDTVLPGKTLADVVAGIFTGVTSAMQAVRDGLSKAWDGIRIAGAFIGKELLLPILSSMLDQISIVMHIFSVLISTITAVLISNEESSISLGGNQLEVKLNDLFFTVPSCQRREGS